MIVKNPKFEISAVRTETISQRKVARNCIGWKIECGKIVFYQYDAESKKLGKDEQYARENKTN